MVLQSQHPGEQNSGKSVSIEYDQDPGELTSVPAQVSSIIF